MPIFRSKKRFLHLRGRAAFSLCSETVLRSAGAAGRAAAAAAALVVVPAAAAANEDDRNNDPAAVPAKESLIIHSEPS